MSAQMTIRLADDIAAFVDQVAEAEAKSRAQVISAALQREVRRRSGALDAMIYAKGCAGDLDDDNFHRWSAAAAEQAAGEID